MTVMQRAKRWASWQVGVACVVGAVAALGYVSHTPPSQPISAEEDDGVAVVGGELIVRYHNVRKRYCRITVTRWLVDEHRTVEGRREDLWIPISMGSAPPIEVGDAHFAVAMSVPPWVKPGLYRFTAVADYECGLFSWTNPTSTQSPRATVTLVRPDANAPPQVVVAPGAVTVVPGVKP